MRLLAASFTIAISLWGAPGAAPSKLLVCGGSELVLLDPAQPERKLWTWRASGRPDLPENMWRKFEAISDCKPVEGGKALITSSSDGVVLMERPSGRVLFYASVPNAHSAELLPEGRVVVAASIASGRPGDRLVVFDLKESNKPLSDVALGSGHGVVWDADSATLWALGGLVLRSYRLADWTTAHPRLEQTHEFPLPDIDGHDLSRWRDGLLFVTTAHHVWTFDPTGQVFRQDRKLGRFSSVKCVNWNPVTHQIVWTQADRGEWWTQTLRFLEPTKSVPIPGEHLYKARWAAD